MVAVSSSGLPRRPVSVFGFFVSSSLPPILSTTSPPPHSASASLSLITLLLGLIGLLNQITAIALIAIGLVALAAHLARSKKVFDSLTNWRSAPAGSRWFLLLAIPPMAMMTVAAMLPPYLLWTPDEPHGYDAVEYHLQVPREWYEAGRIVPLHHNVFSYLPFNVEMHYLLAMHLRGGPLGGHVSSVQFARRVHRIVHPRVAGAIAGRLSKAAASHPSSRY